jgi:hypothetical protein
MELSLVHQELQELLEKVEHQVLMVHMEHQELREQAEEMEHSLEVVELQVQVV